MNETEKLRLPIRRIIERTRGQSQRATHLYVEDVLIACKEAGLKFVHWHNVEFKEEKDEVICEEQYKITEIDVRVVNIHWLRPISKYYKYKNNWSLIELEE